MHEKMVEFELLLNNFSPKGVQQAVPRLQGTVVLFEQMKKKNITEQNI